MKDNNGEAKLNKLYDKLKVFIMQNIKIIAIIVTIIVVLIVILLIIFKNRKERFSLNGAYDIYPEEVKAIYANMVDVSCSGDWHLDIEMGKEAVGIADIKKENMFDYMMSYLDKQGALDKETNINVITAAEKKLFYNQLDFDDILDAFQYKGYQYVREGNKIVRKEKVECNSDIKYVLHLYGYFWEDDILSVDVNMAYLKDGILYNDLEIKLGEYDGDESKLQALTENTSYYRFNFVKSKGEYKLKNVLWQYRS